MESTNKIFIRDLLIKMSIGVFSYEKKKKQSLLINADITMSDSMRWSSDKVEETVRYEELLDQIQNISERKHYDLIETFLEAIAADFLQNNKIRAVKISAEKPRLFRNARSVGVEIIRTKN